MEQTEFKEWAIVELFGRTTLAGVVSNQLIGACSFVRIDVPEINTNKAYTKLLGEKSIYAITPVTEETAIAFLKKACPVPVNRYYLEAPAVPSVESKQADLFDSDEDDDNSDDLF